MKIKIDYYYKHKKTGEIILVIGFGAGHTNDQWVEKVMVKCIVSNYVMIEDKSDFIIEYVEYNP